MRSYPSLLVGIGCVRLATSGLGVKSQTPEANASVSMPESGDWADFEVFGKIMETNPGTQHGELDGSIRIIIHNMDNEVSKETKAGE